MGVSTDAITREVGVCQESSLAIERAAVAVETFGEEDHDVGKLLHLVAYVTVGDFPETEGGDALPHLEGLPDGLVGLILAHLRGVVLYTEECVIVCVGEVRQGRDKLVRRGRSSSVGVNYPLFSSIKLMQFLNSFHINLGFQTSVHSVER